MKVKHLIYNIFPIIIGTFALKGQQPEIQNFSFQCAFIEYVDGVKVIQDIPDYDDVMSYTELRLDCLCDLPLIDPTESALVFFCAEYIPGYHVEFEGITIHHDELNKIIKLTQKYWLKKGLCSDPYCKVNQFPSYGFSWKNIIIEKPDIRYKVEAELIRVYF